MTPSLLCRYTCGSPLGLKARGKFWDGAMILNVAVTNGSHGAETFPFHGEIDRNDWKTVAGRIAARAPLGAGLEVGLSGSIGAQDLQSAEDALHKHVGVDLHLARWLSLGLVATGDVWLPWKYCGETPTGQSCSGFADLDPAFSVSGLLGLTFHFGE